MRRSLRSWLWSVPLEQEVDDALAFHRAQHAKKRLSVVLGTIQWQAQMRAAAAQQAYTDAKAAALRALALNTESADAPVALGKMRSHSTRVI